MFSLIYARINSWVNSREAGDLRRYRAHYDVIVMFQGFFTVTDRGNHVIITQSIRLDMSKVVTKIGWYDPQN